MSSPADLRAAEQLTRGDNPSRRDVSARWPQVFLSFIILGLVAISTACGGIVSSPPAPATVTVLPGSTQAFQGESAQFNAMVENAASSAVNWQVNTIAGGNAAVGMIDSTGLYTAPVSVPSPATVTVSAILQSDSTKMGSSTVTILSLSSITGPLSLSPVLSSVTTTQALQMQVLTPGVTTTLVNWEVDGFPNGNATNGTISASGEYMPPGAAGSHLITAILKANSSAIGSAEVEVTDFAGTLTWRNDNSRSGVNSRELALAPSTVSSATFGKLFSCPLDGYAYAQPLYVPNLAIPGNGTHNVIFVATEMDSVFAFDADANPCIQLWKASVVPQGSQAISTPNLENTSTDIVPYVGVTGTPVISSSLSTLYVASAIVTMASSTTYTQLIYALDLATGAQKTPPIGTEGATTSGFNAVLENQRAALLLNNGVVYAAYGSYNGQGYYHGWLIGHDASTLLLTSAFNVTPNATQGGIWQSGGGPAADANNNIYVLTGDGPFDVNRGGSDYGNSFLRLTSSGSLSVADYFSPCDEETLEAVENDVGASAPLLLPDSAGSTLQPNLMIGGSKGGSLYVVNRDNFGGIAASCPDSPSRVQTVPVGGPVLSTPLFWNNAVYVAPGNQNLQLFPMSTGTLSSIPSSSQSPETLGAQGATPVISANGVNNALIWLIDSSGALAMPNTPAILRVFDPNNLSHEIYNTAMVTPRDTAGLAVKFTVPTVANAKIYVGTQSELDVYGFLH